VHASLAAAGALAATGISARVVDLLTIRPLDTAEILAAARETGAVRPPPSTPTTSWTAPASRPSPAPC
jgi:hypothetical protein